MTDGPTDAEVACFEAGIKFGSLYHQFAGTPVTPASVASLARAMEEAIENQPHCEAVTVDPETDAIAADIGARSADYTELTGAFLDVEVVVVFRGIRVTATMELEDGYPRMAIDSVERPG